MLLSLAAVRDDEPSAPPATDLGYLLHKHPGRVQTFSLGFGEAHVAYPEATEERCEAVLILDVDPIRLVRGRGATLSQYVNDRPYAASSLLSVAIAQVFSSALHGRSKDRPDSAARAWDLTATLPALPVRGGEALLRRVFEPLGYEVLVRKHPLDPATPEWGDARVLSVGLRGQVRLSELLSHLYVLIPVLDDSKHYFVGDAERDKLLAHGEGWLAAHPMRDAISRRFLKHRPGLHREAIERLDAQIAAELEQREDEGDGEICDVLDGTASAGPISATTATGASTTGDVDNLGSSPDSETAPPKRFHAVRIDTVADRIVAGGAKTVVDLGCGEGKLLAALRSRGGFDRVVGVDVSLRSLEIAERRLRLDRSPDERIQLLHGSLTYRDRRLAGFDAAAAVEVIEHLDPPRLEAFANVVFGAAKPGRVFVTTPNREFNVLFETLPTGQFRHSDHRFEWTRAEFTDWCQAVAAAHGYSVTVEPLGEEDPDHGAISQLAEFVRS